MLSEVAAIISDNKGQLLEGLTVTLKLCAVIWSMGIVAGIGVGILSARWPRSVGLPISSLSIAVEAIPAIVLMFWLHYPLQYALGIVVDPFVTAAGSLGFINALLVARLVKSGIDDFPRQYVWAARVAGIPEGAIVSRIMLPMLTRTMLPGVLHVQIGMMQATIFASLISVNELFRVCLRINSSIHQPVEVFTALALFFLLLCLPLHTLVVLLRSRMTVLAEE